MQASISFESLKGKIYYGVPKELIFKKIHYIYNKTIILEIVLFEQLTWEFQPTLSKKNAVAVRVL